MCYCFACDGVLNVAYDRCRCMGREYSSPRRWSSGGWESGHRHLVRCAYAGCLKICELTILSFLLISNKLQDGKSVGWKGDCSLTWNKEKLDLVDSELQKLLY